jgi:hypothetical protein
MQTLSYGYLKPQTGDKGSIFFPALEADIQQLNDHTHNGVNSALISSSSITPLTQNILAASWVATSGGTYRQLVSVTGGLSYDQFIVSVKLTATGHLIYPTIEKVSSTTFYVYTNDNSLDYTLVYH